MKKKLAILLTLLLVLGLCACRKKCDHDWVEANCKAPKTCLICGTTKGQTGGHLMKEATCTEPKTCIVCGTVAGEVQGHTWEAATTLFPKACSKCDAIKGSKIDNTLSGGAGDISYAKNVTIELSKGKVSLNLGNLCDSVKNMGVQVVIQDHIITEFDIAMPGYRMVEMDLLEEASNKLQAGGYEGKIVIIFYDRTTGEQTGTNAEIPVIIQVQN